MDARERVREVIRQIDEIALREGLRAAQRRALWRCRSMFTRLLKSQEGKRGNEGVLEVSQVWPTVTKVCEILNAYFSDEGER